MKTELSPSAVVVAIANSHEVSLGDAKEMYQQHIDAAVAREVQKLERTLRDEFAGRAMQAKLLCEMPDEVPAGFAKRTIADWVARQAYAMADAMIEARK